jgi:predicted nucleic acid-binding protein
MAVRPPRLKLVDASALAAILFAEPGADEVAARLDDAVLAAPHLLPFELASVCRKKAALHPEQAPAFYRILDRLRALDLRLLTVDTAAVAELATQAGISAYDAAYLWLARFLEVELVTLDAKLAAAAG